MSSQNSDLEDADEPVTDIIAALSKRLMNDIAEEIFRYLDYNSLKSSEEVSVVWYKNILYGNIWKKLLQWNVQQLSEWKEMYEIIQLKYTSTTNDKHRDKEFYRILCQVVGKSVKKLNQNWASGIHSKCQFEDFVQPELDSVVWIPGSLIFEMDKKWIGRGQRDGGVILWNRWNWKFKALYEPALQPNRFIGSHTVRCLQFNDDLVVASYFGGEICVWNIETTELLHVFDEIDLGGHESHYIPVNGMSLGGSCGSYWLLSCLVSPRNSDLVTVREIKYPMDEVIMNRVSLDRHLSVKQLLVNAEYALILLSEPRAKKDQIQIRFTATMEILKVIRLPYSGTEKFAYKSPGMIMSCSGSVIQLWDVESGNLLRELEAKRSVMFVQFIGNDYLVSCNVSGKVELWDQRVVLDNTRHESGLIREFDATEVPRTLLCSIIRADEYQIALIPNRNETHSELHVLDFLQLCEPNLENI